jgi:hypothetical protein
MQPIKDSCMTSLFFFYVLCTLPVIYGTLSQWHGAPTLRLWKEEGPPIRRVAVWIYRISSRGQLTRGGNPPWVLGKVLTTPQRKNWLSYNAWTLASELDQYFCMTWAGSGWGRVAGTCECGNKLSGSKNVGNFLTSCKPVSFSRRNLLHGVSK